MHISLTPRLEAFVKSRVQSGLYNNASEVIREALRREIEQEPDYDPEYSAWLEGELEKGLEDLHEGRYSEGQGRLYRPLRSARQREK